MARFGNDQTNIGRLDIRATAEGGRVDAFFVPTELPHEESSARRRLAEGVKLVEFDSETGLLKIHPINTLATHSEYLGPKYEPGVDAHSANVLAGGVLRRCRSGVDLRDAAARIREGLRLRPGAAQGLQPADSIDRGQHSLHRDHLHQRQQCHHQRVRVPPQPIAFRCDLGGSVESTTGATELRAV